jgi:AraC-like DNA-binding protein
MVYFPGEVSLRNLFVNPSAVDGLPETCVALRVSPLLRELVLRAGSLENEYPVDGPIWRLMQVILDELRQAEASELQLPLAQDERLQCVLGALLENPGDSRPIEAWAKQACVSPRTLARLFVRETGMTFGRWRRQARLLEAVDRLGAGEPIARVAFELGYASQSAFTEMFRRSLGVPPAQYTRAAEEPC